MTEESSPTLLSDNASRGALGEFVQALDAFSRAIGRETHHLARWPDLLVQQLTNRLQWDGQTLSRIVDAQTLRHPRPRLKTRTPFPESEAMVRTLRGHGDEVNDCVVSPDGSFIVSAGGDRIRVEGAKTDYCLRVWDARTGRERAALRHSDWPVTSCAVGPGGLIVSGAEDGVALWDSHTFEIVRRFDEGAFTCTISPDGTFLVVVGFALSIIDLASGTERASALTEGLVSDCAVSPDGGFVVTAGTDQHLLIWEPATANPVSDLVLADPSVTVNGCAVSPDGMVVAAATDAGEVVLWDPHTDELATIQAHTGWATSCAFHPNGSMLASTGDDGLLKLWSLPHRREVAVFEGHSGEVTSCAFTPDGKGCVTGSADHTVRVWSLGDRPGERSAKHSSVVVACQFSTTDNLAVTVEAHGDVHLHDSATGRRVGGWEAGGVLRSAGLSPDGVALAGARPDGSVHIWTVAEGRPTGIVRHFPEDSDLPASTTSVRAWGWSPDGSRLVTTAWQSLRIWDLASDGDFIELEGHTGVLVACVFTPDGRQVVSGSSDGSVRLWDGRNGTPIAVFETTPSSPVNDLAVGPDGGWVAVAYTDRVVRIWELADGADPMVLKGHENWVKRCAVSPDGARIASSATEGSVRLWSRADGRLIAALPGQKSLAMGATASRLSFSPDASWLAFDAGEGLLALARTDNGDVVARFPIPGLTHRLAFHPAKPIAIFTDAARGVYPVDLVGIDYGPPVVTAVDLGSGPTVRCPACFETFSLQETWLGKEMDCPGEGCSGRLKINPFLAGSQDSGSLISWI